MIQNALSCSSYSNPVHQTTGSVNEQS
jgi:hypothetical protein